MNSVNFTTEELMNTLEEITKKEHTDRVMTLKTIGHEIKNYNGRVEGFTRLILEYGLDLTTHQKAYVHNIQNTARLLTHSIYAIIDNVSEKANIETKIRSRNNDGSETIERFKEIRESLNQNISSHSRMLVEDLNSIIEYSPITSKIQELGKVEGEITEFLQILDRQLDEIIYCYNLQLSPNSKQSEYLVKTDIESYWYYNRENDGQVKPKLNYQGMPGFVIQGEENNILKNAIIPLHNNADKHAYVECNDKFERRKKPDFTKEIKMGAIADTQNKHMKFYMKDNGFGIAPGIVYELFTREGVTNHDHPDDTGTGMWTVKQFVERNGGKLWFETEQGMGTTFYFTIPYDRIDKDGVYIKEPCKPQPKELLI